MKQTSSITRQELLTLKKGLIEVRSAYQLLEQKRDNLIKTFMELKADFLDRKEKLYDQLKTIIDFFSFGLRVHSVYLILAFFAGYKGKIDFELKTRSIMGVKITEFLLKEIKIPLVSEDLPKSFALAIQNFSSLIPELITLASMEEALIKLATAIEKTRRRVNVLKDVIIPTMEQKKRYIELKLADQEREGFVFNMRFKHKKEKERSF